MNSDLDHEARGRNDLRLEGRSCGFDAPIPCRGNVGMWRMPNSLAAQVPAADAQARCAVEKAAWETREIRLKEQETPNE